MQERVHVDFGPRSYDVVVGQRLLDVAGQLLREVVEGPQILIVCDEAVEAPWGKMLFKTLSSAGYDVGNFAVPPGEGNKSVAMIARLWETLADGHFERSAAIVAIGGGMTGDLAGFAAASWLRGISFVNIPTTLLAMVDASVGGKTGINLGQGKNLVGAFHQPSMVIADLDCLRTLPERERTSGMAEVIKYGVIRDAEFFSWLEKHVTTVFDAGKSDLLEHAIRRSIAIKAEVVMADERESGLREILNFGHTMGHALEAETSYNDLRHGEAVAIGMVVASRLGVGRGPGWGRAEADRVEALVHKAGLPTCIPDGLKADALIDRTGMDKKVRGKRVRYVLPTRIGEVETVRDVTAEQVRGVLVDLGAK